MGQSSWSQEEMLKRSLKVNLHAGYPGKRSFWFCTDTRFVCVCVIHRQTDRQTHTHNALINLPGPLQWSVTTQVFKEDPINTFNSVRDIQTIFLPRFLLIAYR